MQTDQRMKCKLVRLESLSGGKASIYSILIDKDNETLFEQFVMEHMSSFKDETNDIIKRLRTIGQKTGARAQFFKEHEGKPGDGVCALYDDPDRKLRLYCIRYGLSLVVVGDGGYKDKSIRAYQEDERLRKACEFVQLLSSRITACIRNKEIRLIMEGYDFDGDLEFNLKED